ncbi:MAG: SIS domain-containing protein [Pseudomonadota bacterium]|jgi:arabinose-5-phosphate isomerase|nr:KpsF/GutQ family sugar-phosphate isomerase [Rubrivivax sp.]MCA3259207.1 KpsF/GutQ family sugar-phosphate isomerase [Rubrivivax sp.]MCE2911105.1 KpsF/GutQ family sugar-phosphate isomerase [Rubrivivax sp.]MCZ8029497.1 KpsF/GutQ family sugar-phosphate isomerase [Rubrivivax sp.]
MNPLPAFDADRALRMAGRTFEIEARGLAELAARLRGTGGAAFAEAVRALLACRGRVVVMGMGKSGHVGRKIAATLASTGTPAFFVHPAEAGHGDLGMVQPGDVVLALSNSGESDELAALLPALRRLGVTLVAMTGRADSTLARHADLVLSCEVAEEACPLNLAPTASTTAQLALGDALAVALLDARGFREEDFARSHPGGALGRKLLMHVRDLMRQGDAVPRVARGAGFTELLREMTGKGLGFTAVVAADGRPDGIFTDGDLRRLIERGAAGDELRALTAADVMHRGPRLVRADALAVDAAAVMEQHRVTSVLVVDAAGLLVGALNSNDLMRAKVI